jgi:hypothetical protein
MQHRDRAIEVRLDRSAARDREVRSPERIAATAMTGVFVLGAGGGGHPHGAEKKDDEQWLPHGRQLIVGRAATD